MLPIVNCRNAHLLETMHDQSNVNPMSIRTLFSRKRRLYINTIPAKLCPELIGDIQDNIAKARKPEFTCIKTMTVKQMRAPCKLIESHVRG